MTRHILLGLIGLFVAGIGAGCTAEMSEPEGDEIEVASAENAILQNCYRGCVAEYRWCIQNGGDIEGCAADREACKDLCDEYTCEPGEPECCFDYPWICDPL